jgi:hypothetical protein
MIALSEQKSIHSPGIQVIEVSLELELVGIGIIHVTFVEHS